MIPLWLKLLLIASGASLGAWARYFMEQAVSTALAVWIINVSSCFIMGLCASYLIVSPWGIAHKEGFHLLLLYGFVGGYATFAHYIYYVVEYFKWGHASLSAIYMATSVVAGLATMIAGMWVGSKLG